MKTNEGKSQYQPPHVYAVSIDTDIALVLMSPPYGPDEAHTSSDYWNTHPIQHASV